MPGAEIAIDLIIVPRIQRGECALAVEHCTHAAWAMTG